MRSSHEKKKYEQQEIVSFYQTKVWKATITIASGITAVLVLFATVSVIVKPYYEIQRDIDRILLHMEQQTQYQEGNRNEINEIEGDVSMVVKAVHTLLRIQSGEKIGRQELERLIEQFEGTLIYANDTDSNQTDSGKTEIDRITQETLEALRKLQ